ncbi:MAG: hypothetical protein AAB364_01690 [Patescibacteria group bacterium]|mgnify:CR=1 FL=1
MKKKPEKKPEKKQNYEAITHAIADKYHVLKQASLDDILVFARDLNHAWQKLEKSAGKKI